MVTWIKAVTEGGLGPCQGPNQLQNRKGCKADPPPTEVTGDGKFYFSKIVVVSLHVDEQPYQAIWIAGMAAVMVQSCDI